MSSYLSLKKHQIIQSSLSLSSKIHELQSKLQMLKKQLHQKEEIIKSYQRKIQHQEQLIQEKQYIIQQKDLTLQHILKQNEGLHQKIFELNQSTIRNQKEIKQTIKCEIGTIKQQFNFMLRQSQIKNQIILDSKVKQFKRRQNQLQEIIKDLSEKASSNGSFYYEQSHSNIIKSKNIPNSSIYNSRDRRDNKDYNKNEYQYFSRDQSQPDRTSNRNVINSRQSIRSSQAKQSTNYEYLNGKRQKEIKDKQFSSVLSSDQKCQNNKYSTSSLLSYAKETNVPNNLQKKYQYIPPSKYQREPYNNEAKKDVYKEQNKNLINEKQKSSYSPLISKQESKTRLQQILCRTKKDQKYELQIKAKTKTYETSSIQQDKRKQQKLKQINSLKMKVNMLKTELKQQISFCQQK